MSMIAGNVSVDDDGNETYVPNNSTNAAKQLYLLLLADQQANTTPSTTITPPVVTIDPVTFVPTVVSPASVTTVQVPVPITPDAKKAQAKMANTMASWMVNYLIMQATVTGITDTTVSTNHQPLLNGKLQ